MSGDTTRWWRHPALVRAALSPTTRGLAAFGDEGGELSPLPAVDLDDPAQREIGDYQLIEEIGRGGMGVVYRARQRGLDREVAIKLLPAERQASEESVERLRREAQNAALLQHRNIVVVHEMGDHRGLIYFAMQLVRGRSLARQLDLDGRLPAREAARLLRTIAEAIDYAHRLGVLHLDLKPGNILLDEQREPMVADFGLARRLEQPADATGFAGTPGYMAPEQLRIVDAPLSPATDVWALGAMLYELLTGQPPYADDGTENNDGELRLRAQPPRRPSQLAQVPADLEAICLHCLQQAPGARYPDARALADDLGRYLEGRAVSVRTLNIAQRMLRWTRREPRLAIASCLAFLAMATGLATSLWLWQRAERSADVARRQTWTTRGDAAWRLISSGRLLEAESLLLANLGEREAQRDGEGAAVERLRLGSLQQTNAHWLDAIATGAPGYAVALDRAGKRVAAAIGDEEIRMYAVDDGRELWRNRTRNASHFWPAGALARIRFSHDGRHLIAERGEPDVVTRPSGHDNILIAADSGRILLPPRERFAEFRDATYSADGQYVVLRNVRREAQLFRVAGWQALTPLRRFGNVNEMWCVGDGGSFVALSNMDHIELWDARTFKTRHVLRFAKDDKAMAWAAQPEGRLLALGHIGGRVRLFDSATLELRELKPAPDQRIDWLSFSADGRWLAAASAGRNFVWDVASGSGGALPAMHGNKPARIEVDAASGTVFATHPPDAILWYLPASASVTEDLGTRLAGVRTLIRQLPIGAASEAYAASYAPAAQLAASINVDGELRLWRWREPQALRARAAAQSPAEFYFDGRHVAVADGRIARVVAITNERAVSPDMVHPQPVGMATLAPDGDTLITANGRELRVFDWRRGRLRYAPIVLENSPLRVAISPDSGVLLTGTGAYRNGRFHEILRSHDLRTGRLQAASAVPGPLAGLRFDPSGSRVVLWRYGEIGAYDAASLRPIGKRFPIGPDTAAALRRVYSNGWNPNAASEAQLLGTPVVDAAFEADGNAIQAITMASSYADASLLRLDPRNGRTLEARSLGKSLPYRLFMRKSSSDTLAWTASGTRWFNTVTGQLELPHIIGNSRMPQIVSRDGRWLASASDSSVQLTDYASKQWATALLIASLPAGDRITQVAFAPDGRSLLARSHHGRWLWWLLRRESQPLPELNRRLDHLQQNRKRSAPSATTALSPAQRAVLRANDPGPPRIAMRAHSVSATPEPSGKAPAPGYAFVDLKPAINRTVGSAGIVHADGLGRFASLPAGTQRYLGIDFDIDGVIALGMRDGPQTIDALPFRSASILPPQPRFDAVHLLLGGCCMLQGRPLAPYGYLSIVYTDGSKARIPLLYHHDVFEPWTDPGDAHPARIAWVETAPRAQLNFSPGYRLYATRIANPHPQRDVATLSFEANDLAWSGPLIFAVTAETGNHASTTNAPPIAGGAPALQP